MPKKMKRAALISALSDKFANKNIVIVNEVNFKAAKTKEAAKLLQNLNLKGKNMVALAEINEKEQKAFRNLEKTKTIQVSQLNTYEVLNFKKLLLTVKSVEAIEALWGKK